MTEREVEEVNARTGRPKVENPKNIRYSIRLDEETEEKLKNYCEKYNLTKGEAIRKGIEKLLEEN